MPSKTVKIPNISCSHCIHTIKNELGDLEGVTQVEASVDSKMVTIKWNEPLIWDHIKAQLAEINYPPENE